MQKFEIVLTEKQKIRSLEREVARLREQNKNLWEEKEALQYDLDNAKKSRFYWQGKYKRMRSQAKHVLMYVRMAKANSWYFWNAEVCLKNLFKI